MKELSTKPETSLILEPIDARRLASLCGQFEEHIQIIEKRLDIDIRRRDHIFYFYGPNDLTQYAADAINQLYELTSHQGNLCPRDVHLQLQQSANDQLAADTVRNVQKKSKVNSPSIIRTKKGNIRTRGLNQQRYVQAIQTHDINFGTGPAGTGKTFLAVACAVEALSRDEVNRILLVRPAVEAGERLGFLPGDLAQKVDPYLRPLYDALQDMLGFETVTKLQERSVIEIAPLAYMRGRTLNDAFIILDESQNTTKEQMKMFLTRIGFGSTAVITGDMSQIDLPRGVASGLKHACEVLENVDKISFTHFKNHDVVRHPIVQCIVDAYDAHENK